MPQTLNVAHTVLLQGLLYKLATPNQQPDNPVCSLTTDCLDNSLL